MAQPYHGPLRDAPDTEGAGGTPAAGGDHQRQCRSGALWSGEYFRFVLRAGPAGRAKPYSDMYLAAAQRFGLAPAQILHVGDDLTTDVAGAVRSGMQACWVNDRGRSLLCAAEGRLLPHVEISRLDSLLALI